MTENRYCRKIWMGWAGRATVGRCDRSEKDSLETGAMFIKVSGFVKQGPKNKEE
jgi:hypothetical protein